VASGGCAWEPRHSAGRCAASHRAGRRTPTSTRDSCSSPRSRHGSPPSNLRTKAPRGPSGRGSRGGERAAIRVARVSERPAPRGRSRLQWQPGAPHALRTHRVRDGWQRSGGAARPWGRRRVRSGHGHRSRARRARLQGDRHVAFRVLAHAAAERPIGRRAGRCSRMPAGRAWNRARRDHRGVRRRAVHDAVRAATSATRDRDGPARAARIRAARSRRGSHRALAGGALHVRKRAALRLSLLGGDARRSLARPQDDPRHAARGGGEGKRGREGAGAQPHAAYPSAERAPGRNPQRQRDRDFDRALRARAYRRADAGHQRGRRSIRHLPQRPVYRSAHPRRPVRRLSERRPRVGRAPRRGLARGRDLSRGAEGA